MSSEEQALSSPRRYPCSYCDQLCTVWDQSVYNP
jgi:hypothetical protein